MMSSHKNQYSELHRTLTQMPPSLISAEEKVSPKSSGQERRISPHATRNSPYSASMPSLPYERGRGPPLAASMHAPPSPNATESDDSFARDFFGNSSKRKSVKRGTWFSSRRNFKDDDDEYNMSYDSLRDPLNLPEGILKRDRGDLRPADSEKTFDYDYTSLGRGAEEIRHQQKQLRQEQPQSLRQEQRSEQPRQLKTLQEHVMSRHQENEFGSPSRHQTSQAMPWAAAAAPNRRYSNHSSDEDDTSYQQNTIHDERYGQQTNFSQLQNQRQRDENQFSKRNYIQELRRQQQPEPPQNQHETKWEETSLIHDIIEATDARGRNGEPLSRNQVLAELGIRLDEQEQFLELREQSQPQDRHVPRRAIATQPQQQQQNHPLQGTRTSKLPDDQAWIQDVLQSAKKGNISAEVLNDLIESISGQNRCDANDIQHSQLQGKHRNSVESWMADALQSASKGSYSADVLETLIESTSEQIDEDATKPSRREERNSIDSWVIDALKSAKREGYSADALKALVDSLPDTITNEKTQQPPKQDESPCFRDRNTIDSWMADAQHASSACPDILQELLESKVGSTGHDSSTKQNSSSSTLQHSIFMRDSRGPVPTDDMLGESLLSFEGSSNGSRVIGDDVLVIQRRKDESIVDAAGKLDSSMAKESGGDNFSGTPDDAMTAYDLIDQLGPGVDIESIPNDVLTAFGLTKKQLRRAESTGIQARDAASRAPAVKSGDESRPADITEIRNSPRKQVYRQMPSLRASDEVSWVDEVQSPTDQVNDNTGNNGRNSECSSQKSSLSSSMKEFATDNRGPIPEVEMLEETFNGLSTRESLEGSLKNLINVVEDSSTGRDDSTHPSSNKEAGSVDDAKPSLGFMRQRQMHRGLNGGASPQDDLGMTVMKKRLQVLASIEASKQQQERRAEV